MLVPRALLPLLALGFSACSLLAPKFERPTLSVSSVEWVGGNLLQQNFRVKLYVQNPNDRALPVTALHAELNVAGDTVASGTSNRAFVVAAHDGTEFDMNITANMGLALLKLANSKDRHADSIEYTMTGAATVDLPFLRDVPFHQNGSLSLHGS